MNVALSPRAQPLSRLLAVVRWWEWADSKLPLYLAGMYYATSRATHPGLAQAGRMIVLVALLCCYAAFGHIINDYADRAADRAAGKPKLLATWSEPAALLAVLSPALATALLTWALPDRGGWSLVLLALAMATIYSVPPVRLKERGVLGWIAAALAQRTLPVAIVFQAFGVWDAAAAGFTMLNTLIGFRFIIVHQLRDSDNDRRSGVRTVATGPGAPAMARWLPRLLVLEVVCACAVLLAMAFEVPAVLLAVPVYAAELFAGRHRGLPSSANYFVFNGFYAIAWPVALALPLTLRDPVFLPALLLPIALAQRAIRFRVRQMVRHPAIAARRNPGTVNPGTGTVSLVIDKGDPYPHYARLRAIAPVLRLDWPGLGQTWIVTRHREALTVFKDPRFVRSAHASPVPDPARQAPVRGFGHDLVDLDPPDHTRLRRLVSKAFTPRVVERLAPRIEQLADEILDRAAARGEIELISDYASVIPLTTISELLGVPVGDPEEFRAFLHALTLSQMSGRSSSRLERQKSRFTRDLHAIFAARRAEPRDDLVTALVRAEQDGDQLTAGELVGMVYLLLLAGFMTTVNLIGNGMLSLLRHPEQLDLWRRNPALADAAVEELLRYDGPLELASVCYATTGLVLGDRPVPKGAAVRVLIPCVNRDPDQFADPDRLDITRDPCPHLSFGQGIHHCLGAPLARLEGRIALGRLIARAPNARLIDPARIAWLPHPVFRGVRSLPLRL